jgi:GT2 family glycosyltransferase
MAHVTVIIPAYNPGIYLKSTLESVIAQTFADWNVIVVDDGSKEDLSYAADMDHRIRVVRQKNGGVSVARNMGMRETSSELVAFLDADDIWLPTKLEAQVAIMDADTDIGLCHTHFHVVDEKLHKISDGYGHNITNYRELLKGCGIFASSVMVRRSSALKVGLSDPFLTLSQDYDLWLKIACFYKIARVPTVEALYRRHSNNRSHNYGVTHGISVDILQKHIRHARLRGDMDSVRAAQFGIRSITHTYGCKAFDQARQAMQKGGTDFAPHLWWAARRSPHFVLRSLLSYAKEQMR